MKWLKATHKNIHALDIRVSAESLEQARAATLAFLGSLDTQATAGIPASPAIQATQDSQRCQVIQGSVPQELKQAASLDIQEFQGIQVTPVSVGTLAIQASQAHQTFA